MESTLTSEVKVSRAATERNEPAAFTRTGEASHRTERSRTSSTLLHSDARNIPARENTLRAAQISYGGGRLLRGEAASSEQQNQVLMDPSGPGPLYLRSTSTVSLNERFSQVLQRTQLTRPNRTSARTSGPVVLQPRRHRRRAVLVLAQAPPISQRITLRRRRRRSVWTRLGCVPLSRRLWSGGLPGFWSFRRKYTWRARSGAPYRRRRNMHRSRQRHLVTASDLHTATTGGRLGFTLQRGGATGLKGRGFVPTRKQLDAQLDEYMSLSRRRLDQQLEDYMSMSRRRLDQDLDEYMLMAGQTLQD